MARSATAGALPLVAVLTVVWGTNWALFPYAVREVSVWTFRAVGLFAAGGMLLAIARWRGESLRVPREAWRVIVLAAVVYLVVWNVASTYSAILIPSGQASILGFTMPAWAALAGWLLFGDRPSRRVLLAVAFAALGVGLLAWAGRHAYAAAPAGFAFGLVAAIGWALGTLILKRAKVPVPALVLTGWQLLIAAVPIALIALAVGDRNWFVPSWQSIAVIAYIALVPMAIGNAVWFAIVGRLPATVSGLSSVMTPMVAMATGALVHGEPLGPWQLAAMACSAVALGLALLPGRAAGR